MQSIHLILRGFSSAFFCPVVFCWGRVIVFRESVSRNLYGACGISFINGLSSICIFDHINRPFDIFYCVCEL
jgi:hypothetical protein